MPDKDVSAADVQKTGLDPVKKPMIVQKNSLLFHVAMRVFNTPLAITAEKLDVILRVLGPRIGLEPPETEAVTDFSEPERYRQYTGDGIGVIPVYGTLIYAGSWIDSMSGVTTYQQLGSQFDQAMNDGAIDTILLRIRSNGGEVSGLFDLVDKIYAARGVKRVVAIADEEAYSAAYAIYSAAGERYLARTAGIGSIGVRAVHRDQSGFDEKLGVRYETLFEGARKNDFDPHGPMSDEAREILATRLKETYALFAGTVSRNLDLPEKNVRETEAGIFFGQDAVSRGLADGVKSYEEVIQFLTPIAKSMKGAKSMPPVNSDAQQATEEQGRQDVDKIREQARDEGRKAEQARQHGIREKVSLMGFCLSAEAQHKLTEKLIGENVSIEASAALIMQAAADQAKQSTIVSTTTPMGGGSQGDPWNNALLAECRKRAEQAKAQGGNI